MLESDFINRIDIRVLGLVLLLMTSAACEVGFRVGRRMKPRVDEVGRAHVGTIEAAVLGMLALLLGFTFAMGVSRYDLRKQLVLDEANAIGTAHLRTRLVPDPAGAELRALLVQYVDARLAETGVGDRRPVPGEARALQAQVWTLVVGLSREDPRSIPTGLLVQSVNDLIDLDNKRLVTAHNHIPSVVLLVLFLVATVALGWVGCGMGLGPRRSAVTTLILSLLITTIVVIIIDLDRPRRGLIKVSQDAMIDLARSLRGG